MPTNVRHPFKSTEMKVLLIAVNAKYIHSNLAVYSLRAYVRKHGFDVDMKEYTINQQKATILGDIYRQKPEVVAFSCYIWNISLILELVCDLKKVLPKTEIWMGGPEATYDAESLLRKHWQIKGIMCGEGERTFLELVEHYTHKQKMLHEIAGIIYRDAHNELCRTSDRMPMELSEVCFPYADLDDFAHRIIYYETSRGCPFSCSYCLSSIDKKLRFRNLDLVWTELSFFLEHRVKQVKFVDRTFNCKKEHARAIWEYLVEYDNGVTNFHFEIAADLLEEEDLALFRKMRPGLIQLEIGVQTTYEPTLTAIHRSMDFSKVSYIVKRIQEGKNIHQHLDLIVGLPEEKFERFQVSFDDVYRLHPQQLQLGFLKVLKGSYMWKMQSSYDLLYEDREPYEVLSTRWVSYDDILRLKQVEEMTEIYYNSGQFTNTLQYMESKEESPFGFFLALGKWYAKRYPEGLSHSRMARYELLRAFLRERYKNDEEVIDELLTLDYYLRENAKSRPSWREEKKGEKEKIITLYEQLYGTLLADYQGYDRKQIRRMTHLEFFSHDLLASGEGRECAILFDYKRRDPLSGNAICHTVLREAVRDG